MKNLTTNYLYILICCSIIQLCCAACIPTTSVDVNVQPPIVATSSTDISEISSSDLVTPTILSPQEIKEPSVVLSSTVPTLSDGIVITTPNGVSLQYPSDWQLIDLQKDVNPKVKEFSYLLRPPTGWPIAQIWFDAESLPRDQEPTLYLHTGEQTSLYLNPATQKPREGFPPTLVVWDKSVTIHEKDWHLRIQGESVSLSMRGYTFEGLDYLAEKGAITVGSMIAIHYEQEKEFYVLLSRELDRDMLIALDAQGADAMIAEHLQQFMAILNSVTFAQ